MSDIDDWFFENVLYFTDPDGRQLEPGPIVRWQAWWHFAAERASGGPDPVRALAARQGFVVTTAQAAALGVTRAQARTRVCTGQWSAPRPGVLAPLALDAMPNAPGATGASVDDRWSIERRQHAVAASAVALRNAGGVVSGRSSAVLHGLPTFRSPQRPVLTVAGSTTAGRRGAVLGRQATLRPAEVTDWYGVRVTTAARTLVDLARLDRRDAVIAADAALREDLLSPALIALALAQASGWPGVRQARAVLALADPRSESPLESLVRLALHDSGLPAPDLQVPIAVPGRRLPYRVDFLWLAQRLVLEADGLGKYTGAELAREKRREQQLRRLGYRVERVIWSDVVDEWALTEALLRDALR